MDENSKKNNILVPKVTYSPSNYHQRVNGPLLDNYLDKLVTVVGTIQSTDASGQELEFKLTDGKIITVCTTFPIRKFKADDLFEVEGKLNPGYRLWGKVFKIPTNLITKSIPASNPNEGPSLKTTFDANLYKEMIETCHTHRKHFLVQRNQINAVLSEARMFDDEVIDLTKNDFPTGEAEVIILD